MDDTSPDGDNSYVSSSTEGSIETFDLTRTGLLVGVTNWYTYDNRGRIQTISATGAAQKLAYQYDGVGNVTKITDYTVTPTPEVINYTYDELDRLKTATGAAAEYNYDEIGRMLQNGDFGILQYTYGDDDHVHAVTNGGGGTYTYDENGNLEEELAFDFNYEYDAENRLVSSPMSWDWTTTYTYDGQGNMVERDNDIYGSHARTVYIGGLYEHFSQGASTGNTKYYWAFGRRIAVRRSSSIPSNPGYVYYMLADHLGSTNTVLHSSGAVMQDTRYRPYGWVRRGDGGMTDKQFTGQQREYGPPDFGLYYYGARFYSTALGRFLSADPLVGGAGGLTANPQSLDGFSYVLNNPLRYTDPTGLCFRNPVTGEMLHCSQREAFEWTVCASSPMNCRDVASNRGIDTSKYTWDDWAAICRMARGGISSTEFKESYADYLSGADFSELEHYANPRGKTPKLIGAYYGTLGEYGLISLQGDTGNLDDIAGWLGDRGRDIVRFATEDPDCAAALVSLAWAEKFAPQYSRIARFAVAYACTPDLIRPPGYKTDV